MKNFQKYCWRKILVSVEAGSWACVAFEKTEDCSGQRRKAKRRKGAGQNQNWVGRH